MPTVRRASSHGLDNSPASRIKYANAVVRVNNFLRLRAYTLRLLELRADTQIVSGAKLAKYVGLSLNCCGKRLREAVKCGWVKFLRTAGYMLTPKGLAEAKTLRRRQVIVARFLAFTLGKPVAAVRQEADLMEGRLSAEIVEAMAKKLNLSIKASSLGNPIYESLRQMAVVKAEQPRFGYEYQTR